MSLVQPINPTISSTPKPTPAIDQPKLTFTEVLQGVRKSAETKTDLHAEIRELQQLLLSGRKIPPEKLLVYQIKAGQYGMRVELVTKLAESMLATVRRFQNSQ